MKNKPKQWIFTAKHDKLDPDPDPDGNWIRIHPDLDPKHWLQECQKFFYLYYFAFFLTIGADMSSWSQISVGPK